MSTTSTSSPSSLPSLLLFAEDVQATHDSRVRTLQTLLAWLDDQLDQPDQLDPTSNQSSRRRDR